MLKTAMIAMTVLGCDCDVKTCVYIKDAPSQWTTIEECETALKSNAIHDGMYDYPLVMAMCRPSDAAQPKAELISADLKQSTRQATVSNQSVEPDGKSLLVRTAKGYVLVKSTVGSVFGGATTQARSAMSWLYGQMPFVD